MVSFLKNIDTAKSFSAVAAGVNPKKSAEMVVNGKPKERRRNNEKRKEKSREAARFRRSRETEVFTELSQILPLRKEDISQLDKASVMRIAIAYLKIREHLQLFPKIQNLTGSNKINSYDVAISSKSPKNTEVGSHFFDCIEARELIRETLDGFMIMLSTEGEITYTSNNIAEFLGIEKIDILGQQIWDYTHQCDHAELREALNIKRNGSIEQTINAQDLEEELLTYHRDLFLRFKCTLTGRGRNINVKSASYKVIHITGHLIMDAKEHRLLIAVGRPIPHPSNIEIPLGTTTFLTKHSTDMKFTYVDEKMSTCLGYNPEDLKGKSLFDFHHAADSGNLLSTFKNVFNKGQSETGRYRFLGKSGGFCWVVTQATILYEKLKPQSVVCVNYVISNLESNNEIYSIAQYEASQHKKVEDNNIKISNNFGNNNKSNQQPEPSTGKTIKERNLNLTNKNTKINTFCKNSNNNNNNNNNNKYDNDNNDGTLESASTNLQATDELTKNIETAEVAYPIDITADIVATSLQSAPAASAENLLDTLGTSPTSSLRLNFENSSLNKSPIKPLIINESSKPINQTKQPKSVTASVFRVTPAINANTRNANKSTTAEPQQQISQTILLNTSQLLQSNVAPRAQSVTASVFTPISALPNKQQQEVARAIFNAQQQLSSYPRSPADMNKGFQPFTEDAAELTMLKQEPDDLTSHMEQNSADACIPLDEPTPLFGEMLAGLIPYGSLMSDINSIDSTADLSTPTTAGGILKPTEKKSCSDISYNNKTNKHNTNIITLTPSSKSSTVPDHQCSSPTVIVPSSGEQSLADPFINYREESNDTICSRHLISPSLASKSPEASSLPSLCSPSSLSQEDEFAFMTMNVGEDIDLTMRAPYIPMNEQEDLPLLTTDDLMWCAESPFSAEELNIPKDETLQYDILKDQMRQQQQPDHGMSQEHFQNSLCLSSPSDSSLSSTMNNQQQHIRRSHQIEPHSDNNDEFPDSGELVALLCGSSDVTFSAMSIKKEINGGERTLAGFSKPSDGSAASNKSTMTAAQKSHAIPNTDFKLQQQQQQQQQERNNLDDPDSKPKNLENGTSHLCICIEDSCNNVYNSKDSNPDCWRELLQIDINDVSSILPTTTDEYSLVQKVSPTLQQQRQRKNYTTKDCIEHSQMRQSQMPVKLESNLNNTPLRSTTSVKLNVPLIQNSKSNLQQDMDEEVILGESLLAPKFVGKDAKILTKKLSNITTLTLTYPATEAENLTVIDGDGNKFAAVPLLQQQQQQQQQQQNNKRHFSSLAAAQQVDAKRLKNSKTAATIELQNSLQQLKSPVRLQMTPAESKGAQQIEEDTAIVEQQWPSMRNMKATKGTDITAENNQKQEQASNTNSVLKNLLISGCDNTSDPQQPGVTYQAYKKNKSVLTDGNKSQQHSLPSKYTSKHLDTPLSVSADTLCNSQYNPMIGGPILLSSSPLTVNANGDPRPPNLRECDIYSMGNNLRFLETNVKSQTVSNVDKSSSNRETPQTNAKGLLLSSGNKAYFVLQNHAKTHPLTPLSRQTIVSNKQNKKRINNENKHGNGGNHIGFISYVDYPRLTPLLMDLCNDDYNMHTEQLMEGSGYEHVLGEWVNDMI